MARFGSFKAQYIAKKVQEPCNRIYFQVILNDGLTLIKWFKSFGILSDTED